MKFLSTLSILAALLLPHSANSQTIYRCQENGRTTFSDKPCDSGAQAKPPMSGKSNPSSSEDPVQATSGYAAPHGSWRGQAQYQAKLGTQLVEEAHAVVPMAISISADAKVTGGSPDNGCRLLGIASPGVMKAMLKLDVTLSQCKYAALNRRYTGFITVYAKDKTTQMTLNAHIIRAGVTPQFFDLNATLRR